MPESIPAELQELRERVRHFAEQELRPLEEQAAAEESEGAGAREVRRLVARRSQDAGFFGMTQPREFGGSEAGVLALTVAREAFAAENLRAARYVFGPGPGVLASAEGPLRERYLEPLMRGEKYAGWAFTEPSGADAARPTSATRDGDALVVNGRKAFVSGAATADFFSVLLNVDEDGGPGGPAMVVIDRETSGVTVGEPFFSIDGSSHCEVRFDGARVSQANVVGEVGEGMRRGLGNIGRMRLGVAAQAAGTAMWVVEHTREHISAPHRRGGTLADREQVRAIFAGMMIDTYAARSVLYRTARLAEGGADVMNEGAMAKVLASEVVGRVVDQAIQLGGGQALVRGHPLERLYRVTRTWRIAEGASDVLRLNVARGLLEFHAGRV